MVTRSKVIAISVAAVLLIALPGCISGTEATEIPIQPSNAQTSSSKEAPTNPEGIFIPQGMKQVTVSRGDILIFLVPDPRNSVIEENSGLLRIIEQAEPSLNPEAIAISPGETTALVRNKSGGILWETRITVT